MELLELSQIIFNITLSVAVFTLALFAIFIADAVFKLVKAGEHFFVSLEEKSDTAYRKLGLMFAGTSLLPFVLKLFKKKSKKEE